MAKTLFSVEALGELQVGGLFFNLNSTSVVVPDIVAEVAVARCADRGANLSLPFPPATDEQAEKQKKPKPPKPSH
jgi:hypothetical protein